MNTIYLARRVIDGTTHYEKSGTILDDLRHLPEVTQADADADVLHVCMGEWDDSVECSQFVGNTVAVWLRLKNLPAPEAGLGYLVDFVSTNSNVLPGVDLFNSDVRVRKMTVKKLAKHIQAKSDRKKFLKGCHNV